MKSASTFLTVARKYGPLLSLLVVPLLIAAGNGFPTWEDYNTEVDGIAGCWISSDRNSPEDNTWIWTETITPLDSDGMRYAYQAWSPNPETNWSGLGLTGVRIHGHALGQLVQTGDNEYYFTILCHAAKAIPEGDLHAELQWLWWWVGTARLSDEGTLVKDGQWQLYNSVDVFDGSIADKDADDDGFPDEGAVPLLCGPWPMESKRVLLQPQANKEDADFSY